MKQSKSKRTTSLNTEHVPSKRIASTNLIRVIPYMHYIAGQMFCEIIFANFIVVRKMQLYAVGERNV